MDNNSIDSIDSNDSNDLIFNICQDIKQHIATKTIEAYIWFATHDPTFTIDRLLFTQLFTVCEITEEYEKYTLLGRNHRIDGPAMTHDGINIWRINGEEHSEGDQPSVIIPDDGNLVLNSIYYYTHGKLNSRFYNGKLQPAMVLADGTKKWYLNGKLHRIGKPAIKTSNGLKLWFINGKPKREHNLPTDEYPDGSRGWHNGIGRHRDTCEHSPICKCGNIQPAFINANNDRFWIINGKLSRINDLPVAEYANGTKCWLNSSGILVPGYDIRDMI